jgi:pilus assembly protein CpaB
MNLKSWISLSVALVLGLVAAVVARHVLLKAPPAVAVIKTVPVVLLKVPVSPGQELTAEEVEVSLIPAKAPPPDSFSTVAEVVGRVTTAQMVAGQPVLRSLLARKGSVGGLQSLVPAGMRAITLDINESAGVAGLLNPGCHVDVVATSVDVGNMDKSISRTIVQDAPVLAVGQRLGGPRVEGQKDAPVSHTVTLLVWPRDAEALDLGTNAAHLRLALRGNGDTSDADDTGVLLAELRGNTLPTSAPGSTGQTQALAVTQTPTTQPTESADPTRIVTVIMGNDERRVVFRQDAAKAAAASTQLSNTDGNSPQ